MKRKVNIKRYPDGGYNLNYMDTNPEMMTPRGVNPNGSIQQLQNPIPNQIPQYQGSQQMPSQGFGNAMNSSGKFAGMAGSMYYGSQQGSNLPSAQNEQAYNKTMAGVSQAGPIGGVIGGVSAIGDAIGKPIRERAERTNSVSGGYQDIGKAKRTAVVGGLFNPLKALIEHPNYNKLNNQMKQKKNESDWNQSLQNNAQNYNQYNYNSTFAQGGYYANGGYGANAELEDNEIFRTPQGDMDKVNGRTHAEGGEQMNLPQNTEILGKNIAPNGISYKKNGDKLFRQFNKYTKILEDKPTTLAKNTAKMMLDKVHKNYSDLMDMQEQEKQMQQMNQMYSYGGLTMYPLGGYTDIPTTSMVPGAFANLPKLYSELTSKYGYNPNAGFNKQVSPKTRTVGADTYAKKNSKFYLDSNEQQQLLGDKWQRYNELRGKYGKDLNLVGSGDDPNKPETWKVGARHAVAFNPASYEYTKVPSPSNKRDFVTSDFTYNVNYDPNQSNPYQESLDYTSQENPPIKAYGGYIDEYRSGGIHINPANKGKFNALKARTGKSTAELTHSSNPLTRKRAIFAQNARKWRHEDGGMINNTGYLEGSQTDSNPMNIIPSNYITTNGMSRPITAMSDTGDQRNLYPNTGNYAFGGNYVMEQPMYSYGGLTKYQDGGDVRRDAYGNIISSESDVNLNKQPNNRGFISQQDASTARGFFGNDSPDIMETRQGAPSMLYPSGVNKNGMPYPISGSTNQQLQPHNQYYAPGQEHTRFIDETPDSWQNKAFDTASQYAPVAYNMYQGLFGKPEHVKSVYNPYESQVMGLMRGRRYNVDPELESNRNATANYYQNLRQGAPSQGRYLAGLQSGQVSRQRADAEAYARKQNIDNQYTGEEASTLGGFGQQRANMDFQVNDMNAQNRAAQRRYLPTALAELQQQTQMNKIMREKKRLSMNKALSDEERQRLYMEAFKGYNFANRMNPITGEAVN